MDSTDKPLPFGEELRRLRDGTLSPRDSWKKRGCEKGVCHQVYEVPAFSELGAKDVQRALLEAALVPSAIIVTLHFRIDLPVKIVEKTLLRKTERIIRGIAEAGFFATCITSQTFYRKGAFLYGCIAIPLYEKKDVDLSEFNIVESAE